MFNRGRICSKTLIDGDADGDILVWDDAAGAWVSEDIADITATGEAGTAQGQMLFWDNTLSKWVHTEVTELFWDDVNKRIGIGDGAVGTPSLFFASDTDTGIYYSPTYINFAIAGTRGPYFTGTQIFLKDSSSNYYGSLNFGGTSMTANHTLAFDLNNANRVLDLTGNATLNQDVSTAGSPTFAALGVTGAVTGGSLITGGNIGIAADVDLLQLAANALTVNGSIASSEITTTYGFLHDRGDPDANDWIVTDFTADGPAGDYSAAYWHDLDCSGVVPADAKAIVFQVNVVAATTSAYFMIRKNGNSNFFSFGWVGTQVANIYAGGQFTVPCDSSQIVEYWARGITWTAINVTIVGWLK